MKTKEPDSEYREKRDRNNVAVRKSREKSRLKRDATMERVGELRRENQQLELKIETLQKEMQTLQDLFRVQASNADAGQTKDNAKVTSDHGYSRETTRKQYH